MLKRKDIPVNFKGIIPCLKDGINLVRQNKEFCKRVRFNLRVIFTSLSQNIDNCTVNISMLPLKKTSLAASQVHTDNKRLTRVAVSSLNAEHKTSTWYVVPQWGRSNNAKTLDGQFVTHQAISTKKLTDLNKEIWNMNAETVRLYFPIPPSPLIKISISTPMIMRLTSSKRPCDISQRGDSGRYLIH